MCSAGQHTCDNLWQQARSGDTKAFELLYRATVISLSNQAFRILKDREQVKDIIQDIFTSLYLRRDELPGDVNISGYLNNAVKYKVSNQLRNKLLKENHHQVLIRQAHQQEVVQPVQLEQHELKNRIARSINTLPQKCKEVFMLNYYGNMSYKTIAQEMGISVKTVEKHMSKALQVLRRELKEEHYLGILLVAVSICTG
ncbi:RNA polymerase sigma-70 factor, ECF subfamily [Chitinophaga ginsengisegetis]|uniref:RNA polymerase sigma-70 factor, ECF subfamily n=1 Tax=Chitinophaga ginsengisegetis TaxID=393003 RepID=A0A1T5P0E1_9BACT|nr:RNA polymerase sigma-70 factor [Chitinophaga ginsengisegetis]SKD06106.1 RNA polymerase sigma-70 factor, ECF subfamily [Chitinophaga ginsengisegetis]